MKLKMQKPLLYVAGIICMALLFFTTLIACSKPTDNQPSTNQQVQPTKYTLENNLTIPDDKIIQFKGVDKNIVLDLNGYCIQTNGNSAIRVLNGAKLTIVDSNKERTHYLLYDENTKAFSKYSQTIPQNGTEVTDNISYTAGSYITVKGGLITGAKNGIHGGAVIVACVPEQDIYGNTIQYTGPKSVFELQSGTIAGNVANGYGGGVYLGSNTQFILNGGEILGNYSSSYGGGISCEVYADILLKSGKIAHNGSGLSGGGIYLRGIRYVKLTTLTIEDKMQILYNKSEDGGAVGGIVSTVHMNGGLVQGNSAKEGGGFDLYSSCMHLSGGKIANNMAQTKGGGILFAATEKNWSYSDDNTGFFDNGLHLLRITGGEIEKNTANDGGNGIYLSRTTLEATQSIIDDIQKQNETSPNSKAIVVAQEDIAQNQAKIKIINNDENESNNNENKSMFIWLGLGLGIAFIIIIIGAIVYFKKKNHA